MLDLFRHLDRRWVFLAMLLAVGIPILAQKTFPEYPTPLVQATFDKLENLPEGSNVLIAFDYDPGSEGELAPMATSFLRHCCLKRHKMFLMTLWETGLPLIDKNIRTVMEGEFKNQGLKYGEHYVNLGFRPGREVVIKVLGTDLRKSYQTDNRGTSLDAIPMTRSIRNLRDMRLIIDLSAGSPGAKDWVQYAATHYHIEIAAGSTAVQAPQLYPYIPDQLFGLLAAIKGAAEYEAAVAAKYPVYKNPELNAGIRRMAPQLWAHLLMVGLLVLGNTIYFFDRRQGGRR